MPFNKISGQSNNYPMAPIALAPGEVMALPTGQGIIGGFGAVYSPQLAANNPLTGQYFLGLGQYTVLQMYDDGLNYWQNLNVLPQSLNTISSDGVNYRIANTTGCPIGALITAAGSGGTNGFYGYNAFGSNATSSNGAAVTIQNGQYTAGNAVFTITPSAGGSLWNAIVGGAVNTTLSFAGTIYNGNYGVTGTFGATTGGVTASAGSNYVRPPLIVFSPPVNQGQQPYVLPTAVCAITSGAISSITVTSQGAGLLGLPGITVVPQPGDLTGGGAVIGWIAANNGQVGSGTLTLMWPAFYGTGLTAVPTFTFGGTSNPAPTVTAIMNFTLGGAVTGTAGAGYGTTPGGVINGGIVAGTAAYTNPMYDKGLSIPVPPPLNITTLTGVPALAGPFAGVNFQAVPTYTAIPNGTAAPSTANASVFGVNGQNDVVKLQTF
jgi:hypothetical protein